MRDNAVTGSAEYRIPVWVGEGGPGRIQFAGFVDYGRAWNADLTPAVPRRIASAGIGLLGEYGKGLHGQLYVARPSRKFQQTTRDPQDSGVHFSVSYNFM